jgi:hypothetical protein
MECRQALQDRQSFRIVPCDDRFHQKVRENVKGALGEALVQKYFEYAGWAVTPTGIEDAVRHLGQEKDVDKGDLASLPDFIVSKVAGSRRNPGTHELGQAFYVEVKTWSTWPAGGQDVSPYRRWGNVLLVWVSPKGLKGAWIVRPGAAATPGPIRLAPDAFRDLASVGVVHIRHCGAPGDCEGSMRDEFNSLAVAIASLPKQPLPALSRPRTSPKSL